MANLSDPERGTLRLDLQCPSGFSPNPGALPDQQPISNQPIFPSDYIENTKRNIHAWIFQRANPDPAKPWKVAYFK